jgi:hypothetical protein
VIRCVCPPSLITRSLASRPVRGGWSGHSQRVKVASYSTNRTSKLSLMNTAVARMRPMCLLSAPGTTADLGCWVLQKTSAPDPRDRFCVISNRYERAPHYFPYACSGAARSLLVLTHPASAPARLELPMEASQRKDGGREGSSISESAHIDPLIAHVHPRASVVARGTVAIFHATRGLVRQSRSRKEKAKWQHMTTPCPS